MKLKGKTTSSNQPDIKKEKLKEKNSKKVESTGSRWAALILLIVTVILSILTMIQGQFFGGSQDESPNPSSSADWQFSID